MIDMPLDRPRRGVIALSPYLAPALRHAGWFGVFLVLAPVIGPRGYGLFMLALASVAIAEAALRETMIRALVSLAVVSARHWSTALVTMIVSGGAIWLALRAAAPLLDTLVGGPEFPDLFQSLAILPLLGGLSAVPMAALHRGKRQGPLVTANVALWLAWSGVGAWSLVVQVVISRLVECLVLWSAPGERIGLTWSARHFTELVAAVDERALAAIWPIVSRYAPCLAVGVSLGPTATGLYMLAVGLAEALAEIATADKEDVTPPALARRVSRVLLPALLASGLLTVALPPLIDLRWWGAVPPAQLLLLGAIPAAIIQTRSGLAMSGAREAHWQAVQTFGGVAVAAFAAAYGLTATAGAAVGWLSLVALAGLWPMRRRFDTEWRAGLAGTIRPIVGAALAGLFVFLLTDPVSLALATVPALSLLAASAWLCYLLVRGDPASAGSGDMPS
jgi:hypothetical protein